jgi:acetyl esterase/lipase
MNVFLLTFLIAFTAHGASDEEIGPWQPANGNVQIPLWPDAAPGGQIVTGPEGAGLTGKNGLVAGKPWTWVHDVVKPTMTIYPPKGKNTGVAVLVFPGGGYQVLAMDLEGTEVCDWLTSKGITCVLVKYRVPNGKKNRSGPYPKSAAALQDAQRALGLIHRDSKKLKINPKKIGVIGFSASGHLVAALSTNFKKRVYAPIDSADKESCRPDFAISLYSGHMANDYKIEKGLNPYLPVSAETPPTLLIHAEDDPTDPVEYSLLYYAALRKNKVQVEMHLYAHGGHAFGLRQTEFPITHWPELAEKWLVTIGMLQK